MNLIEFVGPPGAGKSFFYKKLINKLQIKSIKTTNPLNLLIDSYYRKSSIKPSIKQKLYFVYVRYLKLNSNFLFKKNSTQFINFLNKEISNSKKFDLINKYYREYLKHTILPKNFQLRMIDNLKINFLGLNLNKNNKDLIISEEGFFQKVFLNFKTNKNINQKKNILSLISRFPKPRLIIFFKIDAKLCIHRAKKRKKGFTYYNEKKFLLDSKRYFNTYILDYAKKNKIKIIFIDPNKDFISNYKSLLKHISFNK